MDGPQTRTVLVGTCVDGALASEPGESFADAAIGQVGVGGPVGYLPNRQTSLESDEPSEWREPSWLITKLGLRSSI